MTLNREALMKVPGLAGHHSCYIFRRFTPNPDIDPDSPMPAMPANEVTAYLEASGLEKELADCVNQVVREKAPDALARLSELLAAKVRHHCHALDALACRAGRAGRAGCAGRAGRICRICRALCFRRTLTLTLTLI